MMGFGNVSASVFKELVLCAGECMCDVCSSV